MIDKLKPVLTVAAGVIAAGLILYFVGGLPGLKQARAGLSTPAN
jgi:hypothetical protein